MFILRSLSIRGITFLLSVITSYSIHYTKLYELDLNYDGAQYGACNPDIDGDGVVNDWNLGAFDNCPATPNANQADVDWNNIGDACDTGDYDSDGLKDYLEVRAGTSVSNPDSDGDGINDGDEVSAGTDPTRNNFV